MKLLLTHGYYLQDDLKEQKIMKPYPPLGLLYISAFLNEKGIENQVFDTTFSSKQEQLQYVQNHKPEIIAIYCNLMTKIEVVKLIREFGDNACYGFPKIVLGGPDITYNCENYLKAGAHYLVIGEGEETLYELYTALKNKLDLAVVNGLAYWEDGQLVKTPARKKIKDLSTLPIPNRAAVPIEKYLSTWKEHHGKSSMTVSTQRGCPYTCKWCSTAVYGQSYRRRPAHLVVEEMQLLKNTYNPDAVWFVDDVFTVSHKWIRSFHEAVLNSNGVIPFECITRAERLNDEILQLLKEAGCFRIWIGAESGSQKVIDAMDRRVDINTVAEAIRKTNALGIETGTFIMLGYPGEDEKDIKKTIDYLKLANPTHYTITVAYPIKGTSLYHDIEEAITVRPNWETSTDRDIDFRRTYPRKFYDYAVRRVISEVNHHKEKLKSKERNTFLSTKLKAKSLLALGGMKLYKLL